MNTKLSDRLHDLASEMPVELERSGPQTLRRARARRAATAFVASAAAVAVVVGAVATLRVAAPDDPGTVVGTTGTPTPTPTSSVVVPAPGAAFAGLWPETTPDALAQAQAQVDAGHSPLRLDPAQTAAMLATNLFGWSPDATDARIVDELEVVTIVELRNADLADEVPPITVHLAQLGRTGPEGIWSVLVVTSPLLGGIAVGVGTEGDPTTIRLEGQLRVTGSNRPAVVVETLEGALPDVGSAVPMTVEGGAFTGSFPANEAELGGLVLWIRVVDPANPDVTLGATAMRLPGDPSGLPEPFPTAGVGPEVSGVQVPPEVAETYASLQLAALNHDIDVLRTLLDPMTFAYNFSDGSDPTPEWRDDPAPLDTLAKILSLPPAVRDVEGLGTIYVFPYFVDEDLSQLGARELEMLANIGVTPEMVQQMIEAGGTYLGPRTVIHADGRWLSFTTGGD